jgi:hypothetical protein
MGLWLSSDKQMVVGSSAARPGLQQQRAQQQFNMHDVYCVTYAGVSSALLFELLLGALAHGQQQCTIQCVAGMFAGSVQVGIISSANNLTKNNITAGQASVIPAGALLLLLLLPLSCSTTFS